MTAWRLRASFLGDREQALQLLLADILHELDVQVGMDEALGPADVVIVLVSGMELGQALSRARERAGGAPILAILPFADDRLERRVLAGGARACYALGTPLDRLRTSFLQVLGLLPESRGGLRS